MTLDERREETVRGFEAVIEEEISRCAKFTGTPATFVAECIVQAMTNMLMGGYVCDRAHNPNR